MTAATEGPTTDLESRPRPRFIIESDDEDEDQPTAGLSKQERHRPPRASALPRRSSILNRQSLANNDRRRRRRSSARFLKFGGGSSNAHENGKGKMLSRQSLHNIYKKSIQMNAENKINAANSWDLSFIDHLDQFLREDENENEQNSSSNTSRPDADESEDSTKDKQPGRINFTKASCSLDASVKIYSYRVDDVHLTSYKVLANLHRSDSNKKGKKNKDDSGSGVDGDRAEKAKKPKQVGPTLESNIANININNLDAAPVVDALFHKMSKAFDEGGAKGLLLANLGTGGEEKGCSIVFDTGEVDEKEDMETPEEESDDNTDEIKPIDISSLQTKFNEMLDGQPLTSLQLVPQLASLRQDFAELEEEGFVEAVLPVTPGRRYAISSNEEDEADRSIHQEALERSRASLSQSLLVDDNQGMSAFGNVDNVYDDDDGDFGGGYDDDDDFDNFVAADGEGERFSAISLSGSFQGDIQEQQQTTAILDAISSGKLLGESNYEYLDRHALSQVQDNAWAGAAHWRPSKGNGQGKSKVSEKGVEAKKKSTKRTRKAPAKDKRTFVNLEVTPDLADILRMPPKPRGRSRANNPLQFSQTVVEKHTSADNLLPPDAGMMGVEAFASLFLRQNPLEKLKPIEELGVGPRKSVAFDMGQVETFGGGGGGDWDDGSYGGGGGDWGDDDDGDVFAGGADEDIAESQQVAEGFQDVRKVEKISVNFATVAKKVDVRRLKQDLWSAIEGGLSRKDDKDGEIEDDDDNADDSHSERGETTPVKILENNHGPLSFYETVQKMELNKNQADVSLPYYFICQLHLANEKGLYLESQGLGDFLIHNKKED